MQLSEYVLLTSTPVDAHDGPQVDTVRLESPLLLRRASLDATVGRDDDDVVLQTEDTLDAWDATQINGVDIVFSS